MVLCSKRKKKLKGIGLPDAVISQPGFLILVETKVDAPWDLQQIERHLVKLVRTPEAQHAQVRHLFLLGKQQPTEPVLEQARTLAREEINGDSDKVSSVTATFEDLVGALKGVRDEHDCEMSQILNDFEAYATEEGLLPVDQYTLRMEINVQVFGRSKSAQVINRALTRLRASGLVHSSPEETGGRTAERWFCTRSGHELNE